MKELKPSPQWGIERERECVCVCVCIIPSRCGYFHWWWRKTHTHWEARKRERESVCMRSSFSTVNPYFLYAFEQSLNTMLIIYFLAHSWKISWVPSVQGWRTGFELHSGRNWEGKFVNLQAEVEEWQEWRIFPNSSRWTFTKSNTCCFESSFSFWTSGTLCCCYCWYTFIDLVSSILPDFFEKIPLLLILFFPARRILETLKIHPPKKVYRSNQIQLCSHSLVLMPFLK